MERAPNENVRTDRRSRKMPVPSLLFALFAAMALAPTVRAADADFNGRWDIEVHAKPADFVQFTTTAA